MESPYLIPLEVIILSINKNVYLVTADTRHNELGQITKIVNVEQDVPDVRLFRLVKGFLGLS